MENIFLRAVYRFWRPLQEGILKIFLMMAISNMYLFSQEGSLEVETYLGAQVLVYLLKISFFVFIAMPYYSLFSED